MKIEFDENDLKYIEKINHELESGNKNVPVFCGLTDRKYSLSFNVIDVAKANAFILDLLQSNEKEIKKLEESIGIRVLSIDFPWLNKEKENMIKILEECLYRLKR